MLKIKSLTKSFFDTQVLDSIDLTIKPGKFTTLLGRNGSGKSTLLKILSGYELPSLGEVTYMDIPLNKIDFNYSSDIFFVHEDIEYNVPYSIGKFINILKEKMPNWDQLLFDQMLTERKMDTSKNYQSYSRGQKMQLVLMIALASQAPVLLLDEITSVIDVYGRKYFLDLLRNYVDAGNTVVMTTNIINELEFYTDELIILKDQKIVLNKSVKEIPSNFFKIRKADHVEHEIFSDSECIWAGVNSDRSVSYIIPNELALKYKDIEKLKDRRESSLEDIFVYYFSNEEENENAA
jgi:ABC-2 type transport system ATP-binding protein